jgi:hypothetical protein
MTAATRARRSEEKPCNAGSELAVAAAGSVSARIVAVFSVEHALEANGTRHIPINTSRFMAFPF